MLLARSSTCGDWHVNSCLGIVRVKRKVADVDGYYALLGVEPDADEDDVRHAAKRKLMETHPDRGGDEESFIEAVAAYQTLCDPERRAEYDICTSVPKVGVRERYGGFKPRFDVVGEPVWYKEPTMLLSEDELGRVRRWRAALLEAAMDFRQSMEIKAGICQNPAGYYIENGIAVIGRNQEPERWAALLFVLREMSMK